MQCCLTRRDGVLSSVTLCGLCPALCNPVFAVPVQPAAVRSVSGAVELPCPLCTCRPAGEAALATHLLRQHRPELARPTGAARCAVCGAHCADGPNLLTHLRSHRPRHRCPHCDKVGSLSNYRCSHLSKEGLHTSHRCPYCIADVILVKKKSC